MESPNPTGVMAEYISGVRNRQLPVEVARKARIHLIDTLAAMIDGSRLPSGRRAASFAASIGGPPQASVPGTVLSTDAVTAAFVGAMAAHGDEADDSHLRGRFHPGCAVVPAALSVAQLHARSGMQLLQAIAAGYDVGTRCTMALGYTSPRSGTHSTHCLGANFGAAAAAAALTGMDAVQCEHLLSYATQQASGVAYWERDPDHVEKAFDFGGMGARNGVFAALFVASGASGVSGSLTGQHSYLASFSQRAEPNELTDGLGERFEIMSATIKKWCVGSPCQAVLDSVQALIDEEEVRPEEIRRVRVVMPDDRMAIVDNSPMPGVCVQHLVALALCDGGASHAAIRDPGRMLDGKVLAIRRLVELVPSRELTEARPARQATVVVETTGGRKLRRHTKSVLGTPDNPMSEDQVRAKAIELTAPILGRSRSKLLVDAMSGIESIGDVRELVPLWDSTRGGSTA